MSKMRFVVRLFVAAVVALLVTGASAGEIKPVDKTPYMKDKYGLNISGGVYAPSAAYTAAAQEIGNVTEFWVEEDMGNWTGWRHINAMLANKTNETYVYVQMLDQAGNAVWWNATPASGKTQGYITQVDANQIMNEFSSIYTKERNIFGNETENGPDNDTHVTILLLDLDSSYANSFASGGYNAGYFLSSDIKYTKVQFNYSNERKIIYIDTYPRIEFGSGSNRTPGTDHTGAGEGANRSYPTIAHEFNHMIQFRYDTKEETWVDEGFSEYAPYVLGYGHSEWVDGFDGFEDRPYRGLTNWDNQGSHYGESYLWMLYLAEHYGGNNTIRNILQNNKTGITGINEVLAPNATFAQVFHDWTLANYIDNTSVINLLYGYSAINVSVKPRANKTSYPASGSSWLEVWGADYVRFANGNNGPLNVTFAGNASNFSVSVIHYNGSAVSVQDMQLVNSAGSAVINKFKTADSAVLVVRWTANATGNVTYNYSATAGNNSAPELTNANVTPQAGNTSTIFNFIVKYTDDDNDMPAYVNVTIGGTSHPMNSFSSNYSTGVIYYYATTLSAGVHNYSFSASDGSNITATAVFNLTVGRGIAYCQNCSDCTQKLNGNYSTVYLNASVSDYNGTCVTFGANDIVFDCQGNVIDGDDSGDDYGVHLDEKSGNAVRNCIVSDFYCGIYIWVSTGNAITNNNCSSNDLGGICIYGFSGSNNVSANTVSENNYSGIYLSQSSGNIIQGNNINLNYIGIFVFLDSTNNNLWGNTLNGNSFGVYVSQNSNSTTAVENTVCGSTAMDISIENSTGTGSNNTCDMTYNWNDTNATGCTYSCTQPAQQNISLDAGWNLLSINLSTTAETFLTETNCTILSKYDNGIQTHIEGSSFFNFNVTPGHGYYTYCLNTENKTITGMPVENVTVPLSAGWNLVGSVPSTINNASTLRANISLSSCAAVAKYDNGFVTYNGSAENDFDVYRGKGYFVYLTSGVNWTIN